MSDMGDDFRALREHNQAQRAQNRESSAEILKRAGVAFVSRNRGAHLIVKHNGIRVDFWPGTGKWSSAGGRTSRGVFELLKYLGVQR